nr:MAG TPA: hypothetical protein [Caudoviricetes sp.]
MFPYKLPFRDSYSFPYFFQGESLIIFRLDR